MSGIRIGRIFGLEIRLDWSWFVVFVLMAWSLSVGQFPRIRFGAELSWILGITAALLLFASVVAHEVAHSLVARRYGLKVNHITLFLFGGVSELHDEPPSPGAEFLIAIAGPLLSLLIGVVFLGLASLVVTGRQLAPGPAVLAYLGAINLFLGLFNLAPGFPLDGGRVLRSILWKTTGDLRKATHAASIVGQFLAWMMILYGLVFQVLLRGNLGGLWLVFLGWFLMHGAETSYQQLLLRRALRGVHAADVMTRDVPSIPADAPISQVVDSYLLRYDHATYPVSSAGEIIGVVSVDDVRKLERERWLSTPIGALVHPPEETSVIREGDDAWDALTRMIESGRPALLVMRGGELVGMVTQEALTRLVMRKMRLGMDR